MDCARCWRSSMVWSFRHAPGKAASCPPVQLRDGLAELVAAGVISSDGFSGLRGVIAPSAAPPRSRGRGVVGAGSQAGRWFALHSSDENDGDRASAIEMLAWALLRRYG